MKRNKIKSEDRGGSEVKKGEKEEGCQPHSQITQQITDDSANHVITIGAEIFKIKKIFRVRVSDLTDYDISDLNVVDVQPSEEGPVRQVRRTTTNDSEEYVKVSAGNKGN